MSEFTPFDSTTNTPADLVAAFSASSLSGITINPGSIQFVGSDAQVSFYDGSLSGLGIGSGILLTSGDGTPNVSNTATGYTQAIGTAGDADLDAVLLAAGKTATTRDASYLSFSFDVTDPAVKSISFNIVFGSEEYPEFTNSSFVDAAAVLVNGVNYALFNNDPMQPLSVLQQNIDAGNFIDNTTGSLPIEYDGVSKLLQVTAPVTMGTNTIKIAIADTGDLSLDSAIFLSNFKSSTTDTGGGIVVPPPVVEAGEGQSHGFWKNHLSLFEQETGTAASVKYEAIFGVDVLGSKKVSADPTLKQALDAQGGGEANLLRQSTAAWANAVSDDINYAIEQTSLKVGVTKVFNLNPASPTYTADLDAAMAQVLSVLTKIDTNSDHLLSGTEVINAVRDVYDTVDANPANNPTTANFTWSDVGTVAQALDAMNNMPHVDAGLLLA